MKIYTMKEAKAFIRELFPAGCASLTVKKSEKSKTEYVDKVLAFDTEATSINRAIRRYLKNKKITETKIKSAWMYVWMFGDGENVIFGRYWHEFYHLLKMINEELSLKPFISMRKGKKYTHGKLLPVYVHNLSYDFAFMQNVFRWIDVFATEQRKVLRATCDLGIEFRCSYILTGEALEKLPVPDKRLTSVPMLPNKYAGGKRSGKLDYNKIRTPETPLTSDEIEYCCYDITALVKYLERKLKTDKDTLATIPMTKTGYVRRDCREECFKNKFYQWTISQLKLTDEDYEDLRELYQGGFTHANAAWAGITLEHVTSKDLTSSYPTVIAAEKYPMGSFVKTAYKNESHFLALLRNYCCIFDLEMWDVSQKLPQESPITASKAYGIDGAKLNAKLKKNCSGLIVNNGRVYKADYLKIKCNEVDFDVYQRFYNASKYRVTNLKIAPKMYLPKELVQTVLKYYAQKTTLKGVKGLLPDGTDAEDIYALYKTFVNAIYGMLVTGIPMENDIFDGNEWTKEIVSDALENYNKSRTRFSFYAWGVWCTSYARHNLFDAIEALGMDYIYADTDSVKYLNAAAHEAFFDAYNQNIRNKLKAAMTYHGLPLDLPEPQNIKGKVCPIGVWDDDGTYLRFKTLGAKRYMYESLDPIMYEVFDEDGPTGEEVPSGYYEKVIHTTIAGANKKLSAKYLISLPGDPFDNFADGLIIPADYSGRIVHTYNDDKDVFYVTDYMGNTCKIKTYGGVHLENSEYTLGLEEYEKFFEAVQNKTVKYVDFC